MDMPQTTPALGPSRVTGSAGLGVKPAIIGPQVDSGPGTHPAISVDALTKRYGDRNVVDSLSFAIPSGVVTGFLGPNGSGKTTTIRMIFGLIHATSGTALIDGQPFAALPDPARHAGILIDGAGAHPKRSAQNHLRIIAAERKVARARVDWVLGVAGLSGDAKRRIGEYSLGMRQRLDLATALLAEPQLLVLDEPGNGLDPAGIRWLRTFLRSFAATGGSVFVSSHQLAELSQLADEIVVINHGRLVTHTPVGQLTSAGPVRVRTPQADELSSALREAGASVRSVRDDHIDVSGLPLEQIGSIAAALGAVVYELTPSANTLEVAFLELTNSEGDRS